LFVRTQTGILGQLLLERGDVTRHELELALAEQEESGERLGTVLVRREAVSEDRVFRALAQQLSLPYAEAPLRGQDAALKTMRGKVAREAGVYPLSLEGRVLKVAMTDPLDLRRVDDLRFGTGCRVEPVVAMPSAIREAIDRSFGGEITTLLGQLPRDVPEIMADDRGSLERAARAAPVVQIVDHLLRTAVDQRASDLHLDPGTEGIDVRLRIDGVLRTILRLPAGSQRAVLSRLKIMSGMDISVRRRPQDGGFPLDQIPGGRSVRASMLPGREGEKAVLRILDPARVPSGLDTLGLSEEDLHRVRGMIRNGQGVILAAGPTGSGKSSTLFGALAEIDREGVNVITLEDPVEYRLEGATQVQVDPRGGLGFPEALRAVLRQDPDVIMVGEVRDRETAEIAMAAAVTGHLVLSTIHTVDAPGAIIRLLNMGVPAHLVAAGLSGVVAQRLVRRLCGRCSAGSAGCPHCTGGYRGRTGVFQVLVMTDALRGAVTGSPSEPRLRRLGRRSGMRSLQEDARRKVAENVTSPSELARVIGRDPTGSLPCAGCGGAVPEGALGCPMCGAQARSVCACGAVLEETWRFCPECLRRTAPTRG
jgi:type IV pilus assembly protein PilB